MIYILLFYWIRYVVYGIVGGNIDWEKEMMCEENLKYVFDEVVVDVWLKCLLFDIYYNYVCFF